MDPLEGDKQFFQLCSQLDSVLETLASMREKIERARTSILVDDFYSILLAHARINEAKERLLKLAEEQKQKEALKREQRFSIGR